MDKQYVDTLERLYRSQTGQIVADRKSKRCAIKNGTKQGDPLSPALFNALLEVVMRRLKEKWLRSKWGLRLTSTVPMQFLQNLRFADDVLLIGRTMPQIRGMLEDLSREAAKVGLNLHFGKTICFIKFASETGDQCRQGRGCFGGKGAGAAG